MQRYSVIVCLATAALVLASVVADPRQSLGEERTAANRCGNRAQPDILLIMADQFNPRCMGCAGDPVIKTPHLDRLAREGALFDNCYTNSPVCMPARISLATGRYPHEHGCWMNFVDRFPPDQITLFDDLTEAGYFTAKTGKFHYFTDTNLEDHLDSFIARRAIEFLETAPRDRPFFHFISFPGPHSPVDAVGPYATMYDPAKIPMPPNVPGGGSQGLRRYSEQEVRQTRAFYYGKISLIDRWIGEILRTLQERGTLDNTLIIFTADHGDMMGAHKRFGKVVAASRPRRNRHVARGGVQRSGVRPVAEHHGPRRRAQVLDVERS